MRVPRPHPLVAYHYAAEIAAGGKPVNHSEERDGPTELLRMHFREFGETADALIDPELNPLLWQALRADLPFEGIATHSVVSGLNVTCWMPTYATVPLMTLESIHEMPVGRVFLSGSANKLLIKYGPQTEWVKAPPIGQLTAEGLAIVQRLGPEIWYSVFVTKQLYHVKFSAEFNQ
jgi:hypothetical protein